MGVGNIVSLSPVVDSDDGRLKQIGFSGQSTLSAAVTIVPAVAGQRIGIHGLFWSSNATASVSVVEVTTAGSTITVLTGTSGNGMPMLANAAVDLNYQQFPWFTAGLGNAIGFSTGGTATCAGRAIYVQG